MKKFTAGAGATVVALAGLSGLSIAPAQAAPFQNCEQARNAGVVNIQPGSPNWSADLDGPDADLIACEDSSVSTPQAPRPTAPKAPNVATPAAPAQEAPKAAVSAPEAPTAAPAVEDPTAWDNCNEAFANGYANIPAGTPGYGTHLDSDLDGIGCELNGNDDDAFPTTVYLADFHPAEETAAAASAPAAAEASQVTAVPTGGADTGAPVEQSSSQAGLLGLSGLALGAAAVTGLLVRRSVKA